MNLIFEFVAVDRLSTSSVSPSEVSTLNHEVPTSRRHQQSFQRQSRRHQQSFQRQSRRNSTSTKSQRPFHLLQSELNEVTDLITRWNELFSYPNPFSPVARALRKQTVQFRSRNLRSENAPKVLYSSRNSLSVQTHDDSSHRSSSMFNIEVNLWCRIHSVNIASPGTLIDWRGAERGEEYYGESDGGREVLCW